MTLYHISVKSYNPQLSCSVIKSETLGAIRHRAVDRKWRSTIPRYPGPIMRQHVTFEHNQPMRCLVIDDSANFYSPAFRGGKFIPPIYHCWGASYIKFGQQEIAQSFALSMHLLNFTRVVSFRKHGALVGLGRTLRPNYGLFVSIKLGEKLSKYLSQVSSSAYDPTSDILFGAATMPGRADSMFLADAFRAIAFVRQTDRRIDRILIARPRLHSM